MFPLLIQIVSESSVPAYRQVVDQVRVALESGALAVGDTLPSVRSVAAQLGVHHNTVAEAYRELSEEGWIALSPGRRAVVVERNLLRRAAVGEAQELRRRLRHLLAEMRLKGVAVETIRREMEGFLER